MIAQICIFGLPAFLFVRCCLAYRKANRQQSSTTRYPWE
jgi:hypothetical protein